MEFFRSSLAILILTVVFLGTSSSVSGSRDIIKPSAFNLAASPRLEQAGSITECWNALSEFRSCSNEIVAFFLNGHTDIGSECCKAVTTITHHCWPSIMSSLGFTAQEGDVLRGYCDGPNDNDGAPAAAASPVQAPSPSPS